MEKNYTNEENGVTEKKGKKIALIVILVISIMCFISHCSSKTRIESIKNADWKVVSTQSYVRDGQECMGYRIYLPEGLWDDSVMKVIYGIVTEDDYYMHTVWFYRLEHYANGSEPADAIMEEVQPGLTPSIQR